MGARNADQGLSSYHGFMDQVPELKQIFFGNKGSGISPYGGVAEKGVAVFVITTTRTTG
jgi:hypothetical protein